MREREDEGGRETARGTNEVDCQVDSWMAARRVHAPPW